MVNSVDEPHDRPRRLTVDFAGWFAEPPVSESDFYRRALVVLDTNVLLDLYRVNPDTRSQVTKALSAVGDRLWVPHQAAIEFSRNRKQVVIDRLSSFKRVHESLRDAAANAVEILESSLNVFEQLRLRNGEIREWDPAAKGLDRESLQTRLQGVMEPAIAELNAMRNEHDLHPSDMQSTDAVLKQVDELLAGRIGPPYDSAQLRDLVEEAVTHRYPNQIPPGYCDSQKGTALTAAGDFLLWRQIIDRANALPASDRLVLLITQEEKPDWWELDAKGRPVRPRPELVQEMQDQSDAHLWLTSLAGFLTSAGTHLTPGVSEHAVDELRRAASVASDYRHQIDTSGDPDEVMDRFGSGTINLLDLSVSDFEWLTVSLLRAMLGTCGSAR